jgi:hypothetical protein
LQSHETDVTLLFGNPANPITPVVSRNSTYHYLGFRVGKNTKSNLNITATEGYMCDAKSM